MHLLVRREGRVEIKDGHAGAHVNTTTLLRQHAIDVDENCQAPVVQAQLVDGHQHAEWVFLCHRFQFVFGAA